MKYFSKIFLSTCFLFGTVWNSVGFTFDLDWSGQFRSESTYLRNYALDSNHTDLLPDPSRENQGGYYIREGGKSHAAFQSVFLKLKPKLIVNDNVYIKSEWWVGDPVYGFFGNAFPRASEQRQYNSTFSRGSSITAQRVWGEFLTDVGILQVGRAPIHWGLGLYWNSGDDLWGRYSSTGDLIRMQSKFGSFTLAPALVKYSMGNSLGGNCIVSATGCAPVYGQGNVQDISISLKYDNSDDQLEAGVNFVKRLAGTAQDGASGLLTYGSSADAVQGVGSARFDTWDIYARKKLGPVLLSGEVPIVSGELAEKEFKTFAFAFESKWTINDSWETWGNFGHAPGQQNSLDGTVGRYRAFYFHPNYKAGLIMFNYQLNSFAGPNSSNNSSVTEDQLVSPYYNPIVNADYLALGGAYRTDKWKFRTNWVFAKALETASVGESFYNHYAHKYYANNSGLQQSAFLGWEMDYGVDFQWDDNFLFQFDTGFMFPGDFYKFSNTAVVNNDSFLFAGSFKIGVQF